MAPRTVRAWRVVHTWTSLICTGCCQANGNLSPLGAGLPSPAVS